MAIDGKYGKVILEHGQHIPDDEPVIVFRAKDQTTAKLLAYYMLLCMKAGSPRRHLEIILDTAERFRAWQETHQTKVPDSETSRAWLSGYGHL
jgi:hypothetical protein